MVKCKWCGRPAEKLEVYTDAFMHKYNICSKCYTEFVAGGKCRKCGAPVNSGTSLEGYCVTCYQAATYTKQKVKQEAMLGLFDSVDLTDEQQEVMGLANEMFSSRPNSSCAEEGFTLSDEDFDSFQQLGHAYSFRDMINSPELQYIWVIIKLSASGIYDQATIKRNFPDISDLLKNDLERIYKYLSSQQGLNRRCSLIIVDSEIAKLRNDRDRQAFNRVRAAKANGAVLAQRGGVYIIQDDISRGLSKA